ncbi:MAG: hypothetical protein IPH84_12885 [Bacteroidales bacterium]|nr:hypothetical protein [Bacteroidales bacterium]
MKFKFAFHLVLLFFVIQACNQRSEVNSTGSPEVKQWIARVLLLATKERHSNDSIGILLDSAELSSKVLHLDSSRAAVLFWKGIIQYEENNYTDAEALFSEAKSIAEKNNYTMQDAWNDRLLFTWYRRSISCLEIILPKSCSMRESW